MYPSKNTVYAVNASLAQRWSGSVVSLARVFENYMRLKIKCITRKLFLRKAASRKRFLSVSRFAEARRGILEYQGTSYFLHLHTFKSRLMPECHCIFTKTRRVEDKFVLVSHILSGKFKSSWHVAKWMGCMTTDEKISGSKPVGGFLFLTEEFNRETVVVQHTSG